MNATQTLRSPARAASGDVSGFSPGFLKGLAREFRETAGVAIRFHSPDGRSLDLADDPAAVSAGTTRSDEPGRPDEGPAAPRIDDLLARVAGGEEDLVEVRDGWAVAAFPLRRRRRMVLIVAAACEAPAGVLDAWCRRLLATVAYGIRARAGAEVLTGENAAAVEALSQSYEEVNLLHGLGEVLLVSRPVRELFQQACEELRDVIGAEAAAAYLPEAEGRGPETVVVGRLPFDAAALPALIDHVLEGLTREQAIIVDNHCQDDPTLARLSTDIRNLVVVPLPVREGLRGGLLAANRTEGEFGSPDAKLIRSIAGSGAVFIENHRLYRELREMMLDLVRTLVSSVDAKDPYTCGHSERVAVTSRELARQMGLAAAEVELIYLAGLLHDIGKIGTPESILQKPGRLDPEERRIVCLHPTIGGRILEGIKRLERIREVVLHHHERVDGQGYPAGLRGGAIPPLARIVSLADAFDAMTSNRPYRPTMPMERVLEEIRTHTGTQFDPAVVDAFFSLDRDRLLQQFADRPSACSWTALR